MYVEVLNEKLFSIYIHIFSTQKTTYTCKNLQMKKEWNVNVNSEENGSQEVCLLLDLSHSHLGTEGKKKKGNITLY